MALPEVLGNLVQEIFSIDAATLVFAAVALAAVYYVFSKTKAAK